MTNPRVKLRVPVSNADHRQGPENAPFVLVEYGDYECPYCGQAYAIVKHIQKTLGDELALVFRNFPLAQIHPHAMNAARIAEAAALQGAFWETHDTLYENQQDLDDDGLFALAEALGLDLQKLARDAASQDVEDRILSDFEGGVRSGVNGTPTFYVNGFRFDGDWTDGGLLEVLQALREESPH